MRDDAIRADEAGKIRIVEPRPIVVQADGIEFCCPVYSLSVGTSLRLRRAWP